MGRGWGRGGGPGAFPVGPRSRIQVPVPGRGPARRPACFRTLGRGRADTGHRAARTPPRWGAAARRDRGRPTPENPKQTPAVGPPAAGGAAGGRGPRSSAAISRAAIGQRGERWCPCPGVAWNWSPRRAWAAGQRGGFPRFRTQVAGPAPTAGGGPWGPWPRRVSPSLPPRKTRPSHGPPAFWARAGRRESPAGFPPTAQNTTESGVVAHRTRVAPPPVSPGTTKVPRASRNERGLRPARSAPVATRLFTDGRTTNSFAVLHPAAGVPPFCRPHGTTRGPRYGRGNEEGPCPAPEPLIPRGRRAEPCGFGPAGPSLTRPPLAAQTGSRPRLPGPVPGTLYPRRRSARGYRPTEGRTGPVGAVPVRGGPRGPRNGETTGRQERLDDCNQNNFGPATLATRPPRRRPRPSREDFRWPDPPLPSGRIPGPIRFPVLFPHSESRLPTDRENFSTNRCIMPNAYNDREGAGVPDRGNGASGVPTPYPNLGPSSDALTVVIRKGDGRPGHAVHTASGGAGVPGPASKQGGFGARNRHRGSLGAPLVPSVRRWVLRTAPPKPGHLDFDPPRFTFRPFPPPAARKPADTWQAQSGTFQSRSLGRFRRFVPRSGGLEPGDGWDRLRTGGGRWGRHPPAETVVRGSRGPASWGIPAVGRGWAARRGTGPRGQNERRLFLVGNLGIPRIHLGGPGRLMDHRAREGAAERGTAS